MNIREILSKCDHTILEVSAGWEDIRRVCDEGIEYATASVCIPPGFVKRAKEYVGDRIKICTVVGFPNGYSSTAVKEFETSDALANGADEIDMVMNIGKFKEGDTDYVLEEIRAVKRICWDRVLKVIIEACLLSEEEIIKICKLITESGADYLKTSTGFAAHGASKEDVKLIAEHIRKGLKIKASGGIVDLLDAEEFILLGADRLGTSRIVKEVKRLEEEGSEKHESAGES